MCELWALFLTTSYNKDKDNKAVYDDKVRIKIYSLRSVFDKELRVISI